MPNWFFSNSDLCKSGQCVSLMSKFLSRSIRIFGAVSKSWSCILFEILPIVTNLSVIWFPSLKICCNFTETIVCIEYLQSCTISFIRSFEFSNNKESAAMESDSVIGEYSLYGMQFGVLPL